MRTFTRLLGLMFIAAALAVLGADLSAAGEDGTLALRPLGALWYDLHPGSLNLTQAVVERYILELLWDPVVITVLQWPAAAVFGALGIALFALGFLPRRPREAPSADARPADARPADPNDAERTPPPG